MDTAASQIGSIFGEIHGPQPLHHPVVGPLGDLCWRNIVLVAKKREEKGQNRRVFENSRSEISTHLIRRPSTQAVWLIVVKSENLDGSLDTEVMQDTSHFQRQEVVLEETDKTSGICSTASTPPQTETLTTVM